MKDYLTHRLTLLAATALGVLGLDTANLLPAFIPFLGELVTAVLLAALAALGIKGEGEAWLDGLLTEVDDVIDLLDDEDAEVLIDAAEARGL